MPSKFVHLEKLNPKWTHYIARSFEFPLGDIDPKSKQPWKKYEGICVLSVRKRRAIIRALVSIPPQGLSIMRHSIAGQLNLRSLHGINWDEKTKTKRRINIPLRKRIMNEIDSEVKDVVTRQRIKRAMKKFLDAPTRGNFDSQLFIIHGNRSSGSDGPKAFFFRKPDQFSPLRSVVGNALAWRDRKTAS